MTSKAPAPSLRAAGRHALIYGAAVVMQRAISVIMLPLYTRVLTPSDYGVSQLLDMTVDIAGILLVAGTIVGMQRQYFAAQDDDGRQRVVSTTHFALLGQGAVGAVLLAACAPLLWSLVLRPAGSPGLIRLAGLNFFLSFLSAVPMLWLQIDRRPLPYAMASLLKLVLQLSLNIVFVLVMRLGVFGILLSTCLTSVIVGLGLTWWCLRRTGIRFDRVVARELVRFGAPYRIATAGTFVLTFGDRFFLEAASGVAAVGLYALSYQFGFLLGQLSHTPVINAWEPLRYLRAREGADALDADTRRGFLLYNVVVMGCAVLLGCGARPVIRLMAGPDFQSAADVVPIIVAAYVFNGWYQVVKFGLDVSGQTRSVAIATWISVIVTIAAYALLIPPYGAAGAAWATLLGFAVRFGVTLRAVSQVRPLDYGWSRVGAMGAVAVALLVATSSVPRSGLLLESVAASAGLLVFAVFVWLVSLGAEERAIATGLVRYRWEQMRGHAA